MSSYQSPEEAARGTTPAKFVRVIGVVVRGGDAIVAQLMNDGPSFEVETAYCHQESDGSWFEGVSGNSTGGFLSTGDGLGTAVQWAVAPEDGVAARYVYGDREQVVSVEHGCALAVFDDVPEENHWLLDGPFLDAWVDAAGVETPVDHPRPSDPHREKLRQFLDTPRDGTDRAGGPSAKIINLDEWPDGTE